MSSFERPKAIFYALRELSSPSERAEYLTQACGENAVLRRRVEALLAAHHEVGSFMEPPPDSQPSRNPNDTDSPGTVIDRYKLLEQIGEGGFGRVYMAEQLTPIHRRVAIKIIKAGMDTKHVIARFEAERQALALMDHPNIAKVLDAGSTESGRPYFVMELVRGIPVTEYCDDRSLSTEERLKIFADVCSAVQHAHQKGIIHRDIKPSNILVYTNGDCPVPKVIDFGIAKATQGRLTDKTLFTQFRQFVGTPAYMSPEQAQMSGVDIDTRSDIYSLGVLLYELLTGKTPLDSEDLRNVGFDEVCRRIREQEPAKPSKWVSSLQQVELRALAKRRGVDPGDFPRTMRGDLDWIVMKAVEKDRTRRYVTADALAQDIERHLKGDAVSAAPPGTTYLVRKLIRRHWRLLTTATILVATLLLAFGVSSWLAVAATKARNQLVREVQARGEAIERTVAAESAARKAQQRAEAGELRARQFAYASDMIGADQALQLNNLGLARRLVGRHRMSQGGMDLRNWEWGALWLRCQGEADQTFGDPRVSITAISISPDGNWLAAGGRGGEIHVWNISSGKLARTLLAEVPEQYGQVQFSPEGDRLYATAPHGAVKSWVVPSFVESGIELRHGSRIRDFCISKNGTRLAAFGYDRMVSVWDLESFARRARLLGGDGGGHGWGTVAISPDNQRLAIGTQWKIRIYDLKTLEELTAISQEAAAALAFSPDSQVLATATNITDKMVYLYRVSDGSLIQRLEGHGRYICNVGFSPNGQLLASASADQTVRLWNTETGAETKVLRGHESEVWDVEFTADGQRLVSAGKNGDICVWNPNEERRVRWPTTITLPGPWDETYWPSQASFSSDGKWLATRNRDHSVSLRSAETLEEVLSLAHLGEDNRGACFSPVERLLAVGDANGFLTLFDPEEPLGLSRTELVADAEILIVNFSSDGSRLLVVARQAAQSWCVIISMPDGHKVCEWRIPSGDFRAALSPDGEFVAIGDRHGTVHIWKVSDPAEAVDVVRFGSPIEGVAFSPDGKSLLVGNENGDAGILDAVARAPIGRLHGHMQAVHAVAFSPDGKRIVTGGGPGESVKIWDVATRQELMTLDVPGFLFRYVAFSPDGNAILAINGAGEASLWRVPAWEEIERNEATLSVPSH